MFMNISYINIICIILKNSHGLLVLRKMIQVIYDDLRNKDVNSPDHSFKIKKCELGMNDTLTIKWFFSKFVFCVSNTIQLILHHFYISFHL